MRLNRKERWCCFDDDDAERFREADRMMCLCLLCANADASDFSALLYLYHLLLHTDSFERAFAGAGVGI